MFCPLNIWVWIFWPVFFFILVEKGCNDVNVDKMKDVKREFSTIHTQKVKIKYL